MPLQRLPVRQHARLAQRVGHGTRRRRLAATTAVAALRITAAVLILTAILAASVAATITAATTAGTGAGVPATAAAAAAEAMAAVLAEAASPASATAIAAAQKAGYAAAAAKGHVMTAAQMDAISHVGPGNLDASITATRGAAPGTSFTGDSFLLQPTRGAIAQMSVNVTQPSEIAASANVIGKAATTNTGSAAIASVWQNPVNSKNMIPMDTLQPTPPFSATPTAPIGIRVQYSSAGQWTVVDNVSPPALPTPLANFEVILNPDAAGGYKIVTKPGREDAGISFKVDGTDYIWAGTDNTLFESGKKYELHLLVGKDVVQGGAISAKPWGKETITEKETD